MKLVSMKFWLVNHSWESFKSTKEYAGFLSESERNKISKGDKIVYFGQGIVFGLFEVSGLVSMEYKYWKHVYPHQIRLKLIKLAEGGLAAKPLQDKIRIQKASGGSSNLLELSEQEYNKIKEAIESNKKELVF